MSATGRNGNDNTAGPDPEEPQAHRERGTAAGAGPLGFADLAEMRAAILRAERAKLAGAAGAPAGRDAVLEALMRARRESRGAAASSAASTGVFALDAGPEPEPDTETPLRSRSGGVNKPRAVVPTPLLAAEAVRLVDSAHTKRARMVTAIGLPAVFLAATGVAVMPTVANAASSSSTSPSSSTACAPGSAAVKNPAAPKTTAPTTAPSSGAGTPTSSSTKPGSAATPGAPQPTTAPTSPQQSAPSNRPSSAPSGTTAPPVKPTPTTAPTGTTAPPDKAPTTAPSSAPTTTPSPSSSVTWWNPLSWLGTQVNDVFNPPASSTTNSTVNKLAAAPAAAPSTTPTTSPTPLLSIGLGDSSSSPSSPTTAPSSKPTSDPTTPVVPQPTSSGSTKPSAPSTSSSSAPSTSSSSPSGGATTVTVGGKSYALAPASGTVCAAAADQTAMREVEWHLHASSLTLNNQKFEGFRQINTGDGKTVTVMVIHADSIELTDMVTYNEDGTHKVYSNGGAGKTVTLTNVTLHVLKQMGTMVAPIPFGPVTLGPQGEAGTDLASQTVMLLLQANLPLPFPTIFTNVDVDQYTLTSDTLNIPGFNISQAS
ncbi:hypothetical protein ABH935_008141 [Catenulispora sp. GAS73]|uniref:hypothetical protein n=1 Tax=Catenulispora sp. GAS73 TaxID=3156269 RepID=UPI0035121FD2